MLYHRQTGSGAPVVLLHGLFGSLENLGAIARVLAERYCVYSLDLPNHGRSAHSAGMDLAGMAHAVDAWMAAVGLERAQYVGHSLGGKVAMELALSVPSRVDDLVVMDIAPVAYASRHQDVFAGIEAVDPTEVETREQADEIISGYIREPAVRSFILKNLVKTNGQFSWRMNIADLKKMYTHLIAGNRSGSFAGRALFIKGGASDYIGEQHRQAILARFANAQLKIVQDTGHWLHAEKPDLVGRMIDKFLSENARRTNAQAEN